MKKDRIITHEQVRNLQTNVKQRIFRTARGSDRVERNALCPCGSRRKFKHCCGAPEGRKLPPLPRESEKVAPQGSLTTEVMVKS